MRIACSLSTVANSISRAETKLSDYTAGCAKAAPDSAAVLRVNEALIDTFQ
jgi:hypothetical protein